MASHDQMQCTLIEYCHRNTFLAPNFLIQKALYRSVFAKFFSLFFLIHRTSKTFIFVLPWKLMNKLDYFKFCGNISHMLLVIQTLKQYTSSCRQHLTDFSKLSLTDYLFILQPIYSLQHHAFYPIIHQYFFYLS